MKQAAGDEVEEDEYKELDEEYDDVSDDDIIGGRQRPHGGQFAGPCVPECRLACLR